MDDDKEFDEVPKFGNSTSSFEDVVNFYGFWESYSTKKSYVWLFTHDISEIRDRRILKHVDKEHKKIQQKARKERNEEVRSLVLFCKKRDKRMQEYRKMLEEKAQQNRLKSEQNRLDQIRKRNNELREQQENSKVSSEMQEQIRQLEENYFNQYDSDNSVSEDEDESDGVVDTADGEGHDQGDEVDNSDAEAELIDDELYCVACNKFFNSESSKKNHDASKKHRSNVELLKKKMQKDEEYFKKSSETKLEHDNDDDEMINSEEECIQKLEKKSKKSKKKKMKLKDNNSNSYDEVEDLAELLDTTKISSMPTDKLVEADDWLTDKKPKKVKFSQNQNNKEKHTTAKKETDTEDQPSSSSQEINDAKLSNSEPLDAENRCATCGQSFPSKNKLFDHLKKTKHSVYLGDKKVDAPKKTQRKNK